VRRSLATRSFGHHLSVVSRAQSANHKNSERAIRSRVIERERWLRALQWRVSSQGGGSRGQPAAR
jgi:hypothetical protein